MLGVEYRSIDCFCPWEDRARLAELTLQGNGAFRLWFSLVALARWMARDRVSRQSDVGARIVWLCVMMGARRRIDREDILQGRKKTSSAISIDEIQ